jgi:hypothetical protein
VLFGYVQAASWIVSDPQGGELPACEADLDVLLNDALSRVPLNSFGAGGGLARMSRRRLATARSAHRRPAVDRGRRLLRLGSTVARMIMLANFGIAV